MDYTEDYIRLFDAFCLVAKESKYHSEITMVRIAEKLGTKKQNLNGLYHFNVDNVIDNLHTYINQDIKRSIESFVERKHKEDIIPFFAREILPLLYRYRDYIIILHGHVADASWFPYLEEQYTKIIQAYRQGSRIPEVTSIDTETKLAIRYTIAIITAWLQSSTPENPFVFKDKFITYMSQSPRDLLNEKKNA